MSLFRDKLELFQIKCNSKKLICIRNNFVNIIYVSADSCVSVYFDSCSKVFPEKYTINQTLFKYVQKLFK